MSGSIEERRPRIHFAPQAGWINDPNGLVFAGNRYHLFAQHNPHDIVWGPMHWLHSVSDDLLHWTELGIALSPDAKGMMFSGSAVIDERNTAGFGAGAMVVMFTSHGDQERQSIAYSLDHEHFTLFEGNPIIENPGIRDFRDPKVFWHGQSKSWRMVLSAGKYLEFYRSENLKEWTKTGEFGEKEKGEAGVFECPDLFALTTPDGVERWILIASVGAPPNAGGERIQYFLGEYDGETFYQTESIGQMLRLDAGADDYAATTFNGTHERLLMGWAAPPLYAGKVPASGYRGCLTLPRKLGLMQTKEGLRLTAQPVLPTFQFHHLPQDGVLKEQDAYVIKLMADCAFEVQLINGQGELFRFGMNEDDCFFTDRSKAGISDFDEWFSTPIYATNYTCRLQNGTIEMLLVMDHTLAEIFADQGTYMNTILLFPSVPYTHVRTLGKVEIQIMYMDD